MNIPQRLARLEALSAARGGDDGMVETVLSPEAQALLLETVPWLRPEDVSRPRACPPGPLSAEAREQLEETGVAMRARIGET
jgi:hypothetical protein